MTTDCQPHRTTTRPALNLFSLKTLSACLVGVWASGVWAAAEVKPVDATWMSLEELMVIEVSSAAKRPQRLGDTTTAIYALGRDDIRRSGASSLPELLRQVPGVQVSRIDASRYAVSIRGSSNRYSGKLLVLLDGRTLYSPLFGGTYWEAQDVMLEDVERVEVIRGSGGTLWGANAVNGVINIISRQAKDTQGTYVEASAGSLESGLALRHGTTLGDNGHVRAYAKLDDNRGLETSTGEAAHDAWRQKRAGFRADFAPEPGDALTVQGDTYETRAQQSPLYLNEATLSADFVPDTAKLSGTNVLARWQHEQGPAESWHVQAYADHAEVSGLVQKSHTDTVDLEWQHRLPLATDHDVTWGLGLRHVRQSMDSNFNITMTPSEAAGWVYSGFLQDEIRLDDDWQLTLGSKLEHNDITGFEYQPSARLLWRATPTDSFWGAVSRSVQTPSVAVASVDTHIATEDVPMLGRAVVAVRGNAAVRSETMLSRELGYRGQWGPRLNADATVFYNTHNHVFSREIGGVSFEPYPVVSVNLGNQMQGRSYGAELATNWQVTDRWQVRSSYSWLHVALRPRLEGGDAIALFGEAGSSPQHMVQLHSLHKLDHQLELDANLYHISALYLERTYGKVLIDGHTDFNLRLGWRASRELEVNFIGRNLLSNRHREYVGEDLLGSEIPRSLLLQAKWTY